MGVEWDPDVAADAIVLKPFLETATYRNVAATGAAVGFLLLGSAVPGAPQAGRPGLAALAGRRARALVDRRASQRSGFKRLAIVAPIVIAAVAVGVVLGAQGEPEPVVVKELVPGEPRVFPVGRLDVPTEGLLVLTNDGELAQLLAHPSHGVEKEYLAELEGDPTPQALRRLREGVEIEPAVVTAPARVARRAPRS